jgi:hypothetical protein
MSNQLPEKFLFISQLLIERTLHYSLDSNKARTLNIPSLIDEALTQIEIIEKEGIPDINARIIIDEIDKNFTKNSIVSELLDFPVELIRVERDQPLDQIKIKLNIALNRLSPHAYVLSIFEKLKNSLEKIGNKELSFLLGELVTTLINIGMSASHIHFCTKNLFSKKIQMNKAAFERLLEAIFPYTHQFKVCLKISPLNDSAKGIDLSIFGIEFFDKIPDEFAEARPTPQFQNLDKGEKYIVIDDIENYDMHAALVEARSRIGSYVNLFKMFDHKVEFETSSEALVDQCCIEGINAVKHSVNRMHYVSWQRRENIPERIGSIIKDTRLKSSTEFRKFLRIVNMHGMALSNPIVESQLINLWTCYETITPSGLNKSTIENVCRRFIPIIGISYIGRLMHDAYDHCANVAPYKFWKELSLTGDDVEAELEFFCALILNKNNHDKMGKALTHLDRFPLLRFKIFLLSDRFSDPEKAIDEIEAHCERVKWQIRRLYRSRNQIVHSGYVPSFVEPLLENGHDYFDQIFLVICELASGVQGLKTFEQCFDFADISFSNYISKLKNCTQIDDTVATEMIWNHYYP